MSDVRDSFQQLSVQGETVRIAQITDTHLTAYEGGKLLGVNTDRTLKAVIDLAQQEREAPHLVLATGDLADAGAANAYRRAIDYFGMLTPHQFWLPGNHDDVDVMRTIGGAQRNCDAVRAGAWQIVLLNSQIAGEVNGRLGPAELAKLDRLLSNSEREGLHNLVCLHHHPVPIGCQWLDQQIVSDSDDFFDVIDCYKSVRAVAWGHVHQEIATRRGDVNLMCAPSTSIQFKPGQIDFALDDVPPGYRWLELHADGRVDSGISRVTAQQFDIDLDSKGYL